MSFGENYERKYSIVDSDVRDYGPEKVAICVGIGVNRSGNGPSQMSDMVAARAAYEYCHHRVGKIILVSNNGKNGLSEVQAMMAVLHQWGVPDDDIISDQTPFGSGNTRVNAIEAKRIMDERGWKNPVVIAQQWHAARVKAAFSKVFGYDVQILKAWSGYGGAHQTRLNNLWLFHLWEWISTIVFRLKGWI